MSVSRVTSFVRALLCEPDGTPSIPHIFMLVFSVFSMCLLALCFHHIFKVNDTAQLTVWLSNMPLLITSLIALIALPYGINKGVNSFSDIAMIMSAAKTNSVNTAITGSLSDLKGLVMNQPAPPVATNPDPAPSPTTLTTAVTGSAGDKG